MREGLTGNSDQEKVKDCCHLSKIFHPTNFDDDR